MTATETAAKPPRGEKKETGAQVHHLPGVPVHVGIPAGRTGRVLWWGGLAAVAAFGVVDWPVAALIGAGSWVAEQYAKAARQPDGDRAKAS